MKAEFFLYFLIRKESSLIGQFFFCIFNKKRKSPDWAGFFCVFLIRKESPLIACPLGCIFMLLISGALNRYYIF